MTSALKNLTQVSTAGSADRVAIYSEALGGDASIPVGDLGASLTGQLRTIVGAIGDGLTSDQAAVADAVAQAYAAGDWLYWPDGTYLTTATIPHLHDVRHIGPGKIKRASDTFTVEPGSTSAQNIIYASAAGSTANDGLSASQPTTYEQALALLHNYGPVLGGRWRIQLAAGTYALSAGQSIVGLRSKKPIELRGPAVGGIPNVPTAIIDGTAVPGAAGLYGQFYVNLSIADVKFANFTGGGFGIIVDDHCELETANVHLANCGTGIYVSNISMGRISVYVDGCVNGVSFYSQSSGSLGYGGDHTTARTQIKNCTGMGASAANSCRAHIDFVDFTGNSTAVYIEKVSRGVGNDCTFTSNGIAVAVHLLSVWGESVASSYSGNTKDKVFFSSEDSTSELEIYYDAATGRRMFGANSYNTPNAKFHWVHGSSPNGASYNSNVRYIFDGSGSTNWLALSGPAGSTNGILVSAPAVPAAGTVAYDQTNKRWDTSIDSGAVNYRLDTTGYRPIEDNTRKLGDAGNRWSTVYAGTGAINTSDAREKQQVAAIPDAVLDAWADVEFVRFKFNDAVQRKGAGARWHTGLIAQRVRDAFAARGLDAAEFGLLCYDEWPETIEPAQLDDDGNEILPAVTRPAGNRYGVRYEEALILEAALMRRELSRLKGLE